MSILSHGLGSLDSFSNSSSDKGKIPEADLQADDAMAARKVYWKKLKHWRDYKVDWINVFPDVEIPDEPQSITDLLQLDMGLLYQKIIRYNKK